ncbi:MAG: hypothetical protein IJW82_02005 [Clostridia bacterium]|nr:hypothetical protein [Clostridia bacterium]
MNILRKLYYGQIDEVSKPANRNKRKEKRELFCYDKLKAELTEEQNNIFEEFINLYGERLNTFAEDKYINGFKMGLLIAIECYQKDIID